LAVGDQAAWLYWQLADGAPVSPTVLTDEKLGRDAPKYVAAKHYFRFIRPGARRVSVAVPPGGDLLASAYLHETDGRLTLVVINAAREPRTLAIAGFDGAAAAGAPPANAQGQTGKPVHVWISSAEALWKELPPAAGSKLELVLPPASVATLTTP
jgi:hypothetical protein